MRALLLAVLVSPACRVTAPFECAQDTQCTDGVIAGVCEPNHACAFPDPSCESMLRYDELAPDEAVAGACLPRTKPPGCEQWHPHFFQPCDLPTPVGPFAVPGGVSVYDTDSDTLRGVAPIPHASVVLAQPGGPMVRVLSVTTFTTDSAARLQITGSLPLIVAAWKEVTVAGVIDAGSSRIGFVGAGANAALCTTSEPGMEALMTGGAGGGGGGGFQGAGGDGGSANDMMARGGKGAPAETSAPRFVRGGCPGAKSGAGGPGALVPPSSPAVFAAPGNGGGALQIASQVSITSYGFILAGGGGGNGAPYASGCGGGGGGSGGYIGYEAPMVSIAATTGLIATGGGGGGGGQPTADTRGFGGQGADERADTMKNAGGTSPCGGAGGDANLTNMLNGSKGSDTGSACGGGGGGGGGGYIVIYSPAEPSTTMAIFAPPVIVNPP